MSNESTETIIQSLNPHLTTLADTSTRDRPVKRRAMEAVKKETLQIKTWTNASSAAADLLAHLMDSLLPCTESAIESIREQTVGILDSLIAKCEQGGIDNTVVEKLLRSALKRMQEEGTEEIRVGWMDLCTTLLRQLKKITVTLSELMMDIAQMAGKDAFSEVLQRDAKFILLYAQTQPKSTDYACERMIRLTVPLLVHRHTAVRVLGIKAMEGVLLASPKGLHLLFEESSERQPIVPALVYDASPLVRDHLFLSLGKLLCDWSPRDRYQYGERILPIILQGTFDELPSVQVTCKSSLSGVGQSCARDLFEADIIHEMPTDQALSETIGLKQLVHICFDKSLLDLLEKSTDFITVRQETALDALCLLLEYAHLDDIVKNIKKTLHYLMLVYVNKPEVRDRVCKILEQLGLVLPSADIFLDVLLGRLDKTSLTLEGNGASTVAVTMAFLNTLVRSSDTASFKRIDLVLKKPFVQAYIKENREALEEYEIIKARIADLPSRG